MFNIGDKVVCVDAGPKKGEVGPIVAVHHLLHEGAIYTVAGISYSTRMVNRLTGEVIDTAFLGHGILALAEVTPPSPMKGFSPYRFVKIEPPEAPAESCEVAEELAEA